MKALTLWQPWATAIALHGKWIENRTWTPPSSLIGERFAVHAGKRLDLLAHEELVEDEGIELGPAKSLPQGAIVATARLVGWIRSADDFVVAPDAHPRPHMPNALGSMWWAGPVGWILDDVIPIDPVPCSGAQGLWTLPVDIERRVMEARRL